MTTHQPAALHELLREIVAYCREAGHDWSSLTEAEHHLAALQAQPAALKVEILGDSMDGPGGYVGVQGRSLTPAEIAQAMGEQPAAAGVSDVIVGRLPTMNQDPYPSLGDWWVQLWDGSGDDAKVIARAYGSTPQEAHERASMIARAILALRPQAVPMTDEQRALIIGRAADKTVDRSAAALYAICETERLYGIAAPAGGEG